MRSVVLGGLGLAAGLALAFVMRPSTPHAGTPAARRASDEWSRIGSAPAPGDLGAGSRSAPPNTAPDMLRPGTPEYDPLKSIQVFGGSTTDIFDREPRDPAFANRRETFLSNSPAAVMLRLAPELTLESVECRTAACRVRVQAPIASAERASRLLQWLSWGTMKEVSTVEQTADSVTIQLDVVNDVHEDASAFEETAATRNAIAEQVLPEQLDR